MPKLSVFRDYHSKATAKVSDNTRTLALSAIAIVWLFKTQNGSQYQVPDSLQLPLLLVVVALALDFFQYVYLSIAWHIVFRGKEELLAKNKEAPKEGEITEDTELYVKAWVNHLGYVFFYSKVIALAFAYCYLISFFLRTVSWV